MQFNYSIRETIESILRNPEVHEKSCFFSGLSSHYSGGCQSLVRWKDFKEVSKDLPLLVAGNESLFVWYDHDDIRQFLDIAINVRGWDSSHDVVRVLKCLESSSREWGHRIPRSFVKKLEDDLLELWQKAKFTVLFVTHSVSEAIYLSERILVLSSSPGKIVYEKNIGREKLNKDFSLNMGFQKIGDEIYEKLAGSVDND